MTGARLHLFKALRRRSGWAHLDILLAADGKHSGFGASNISTKKPTSPLIIRKQCCAGNVVSFFLWSCLITEPQLTELAPVHTFYLGLASCQDTRRPHSPPSVQNGSNWVASSKLLLTLTAIFHQTVCKHVCYKKTNQKRWKRWSDVRQQEKRLQKNASLSRMFRPPLTSLWNTAVKHVAQLNVRLRPLPRNKFDFPALKSCQVPSLILRDTKSQKLTLAHPSHAQRPELLLYPCKTLKPVPSTVENVPVIKWVEGFCYLV